MNDHCFTGEHISKGRSSTRISLEQHKEDMMISDRRQENLATVSVAQLL
jgi:hypothetical protein